MIGRQTGSLLLLTVLSAGLIGCDNPDVSSKDPTHITRQTLLVETCSGCHSDTNKHVPQLTELSRSTVAKRLIDYKISNVGNTVMHRVAAGLTDSDIQLISDYFGDSMP